MAYATATDVSGYVPQAVEELWGDDSTAVADSLSRAYRNMNERLSGLDRFSSSDIPVGLESDGSYPEVLIELNVYEAIWLRVKGTHAGEAFEDYWAWVPTLIRDKWAGIEKGRYSFYDSVSASSSGSQAVKLGRSAL